MFEFEEQPCRYMSTCGSADVGLSSEELSSSFYEDIDSSSVYKAESSFTTTSDDSDLIDSDDSQSIQYGQFGLP